MVLPVARLTPYQQSSRRQFDQTLSSMNDMIVSELRRADGLKDCPYWHGKEQETTIRS